MHSLFALLSLLSVSAARPQEQSKNTNANLVPASSPASVSSPQSLAHENAQLPPAPATTGIPSGSCRWVPGQQGWPSDTEWTALSQAVKGRLLKPAPPAAACHGLPQGDCEDIKSG